MPNIRLSGSILSLLSSFFFASMGALTKSVSSEISASEIIFFRGFITLGVTIVIMRKMGLTFKGSNIKLLCFRGLFGALSLLSNFVAIGKITFVDAGALQELTPVFVIIFAAIFLRERLSPKYIYLSGLAFLGYLFIIFPSGNTNPISTEVALITLGGAISSALAYTCIRKLSATDHPLMIMFYFFIFCTLVTLPSTINNFIMPSFFDFLKIIGISFFSLLGQGCMTAAYAKEKAGIVAIISYSLIFFHLILGIFFWREYPDMPSIIGSVLIVLSGIIVNILRARKVSIVKS